MKVAIRVDSSEQIGSGHFMRCLTIANALDQINCKCYFISRYLPENFILTLRKTNHSFVKLPNIKKSTPSNELRHSNWLGVSQEEDALQTIEAIKKENIDWMIVDHYALDINWEIFLRNNVKNIMVIDDLMDRKHSANLLLDSNLRDDDLNSYRALVNEDCDLLLGPKFVPLREEFSVEAIENKNKLLNIFIFFGAYDTNNYTELMIDFLYKINKEFNVDVVIGKGNVNTENIRNKCMTYGMNLHIQTNSIAKIMQKSSIGIGAGGITVWERCSMQLPSFCIPVAFNQEDQLKQAEKKGLLYVSKCFNKKDSILMDELSNFIRNKNLHKTIQEQCSRMVDSRGAYRIVNKLKNPFIEIKEAKKSDMMDMFKWINDKSIRTASLNESKIELADHKKWFRKILDSKKNKLLVGYFNNERIGVVRFDSKSESEVEISIYLVPNIDTAKGMGLHLLLKSEDWLMYNMSKIKTITGYVKNSNRKSIKMFKNAGYDFYNTRISKKLDRHENRNR